MSIAAEDKYTAPRTTGKSDSEGWSKATSIGVAAEEAVISYFRNQGADIVDLRSDPNAWRQDIDLIVNGKTLDVKADTHKPINLFLSDSYTNGNIGRFWGSRAEVWVYVFVNYGDAFLINLPELQRYVAQRYHELRYVEGRGMMEGRFNMGSGILVPLREAMQALGITRFRLALD